MAIGTDTAYGLTAFADWIRDTDEHAAHRLAVLARVERCLAEQNASAEATSLATKLERWRYQYLNEHASGVSAEGEAFLTALDKATKRLRGNGPASTRQTREAVSGSAFDRPAFQTALEALDPAIPLDGLIQRARRVTVERFAGASATRRPSRDTWQMLLYAPLYVSSQCVNWCTYCGFRYPLEIARKHLSPDEAVVQARVLRDRGFRHVLLVGGDFPQQTTSEYYAEIAARLAAEGLQVAVEIAAQGTDGYARLVASGVCGVTLYQETYDPERYAQVHVRGPKASYAWRLEAHDRAAEAGIRRLGLGILLGLGDPRTDLLAMMRHAAYLGDRFPRCSLAFSLPRIHEAPEGFEIRHPVSDEMLLRMYSGLRIAFPEAVLVLSTRESPALRDRLSRICITQMSAGSSTTPGGYAEDVPQGGQQFPVVDQRSVTEVARGLQAEGYQICWSMDEQPEPGRYQASERD